MVNRCWLSFIVVHKTPKESVKEFGESLFQTARKIMPEFKVDIDNTLKAHFTDGLKYHYHKQVGNIRH